MESPTLYVVRNEVDADCEYHCDALVSHFPDAEAVDFAAGERFEPADADAVVLTGSTAGVYEAGDRPWIDDQAALVRELVDLSVPTLGVCFGHQIANAALGGTVERVGTTARLVEADLDEDPLFEAVESVVPAVHGDAVTEPGEGMEVIASAPHADAFGTRHRNAPLWTVQFHPEFGAEHRDRLVDDFGWERTALSFADATTDRVFENFRALATEAAAGSV
ncbi:type 1 glutamine amidotransferase [Halostella salina]|uniref:type 1 glutamine amidotransferase n=1 Tax=Halostella salina TaxID=1547897 RepID=UPI000EF8298B|nr:gamma-glutamyl-gamma-aminobutyrate hydrolase family protein [Halostella salina]